MASDNVKKAGWVGMVSVLVPLAVLVWNEYEDYMKWQYQVRLMSDERAMEASGPMMPGKDLEGMVDSLWALHHGDSL